MWLFWFSLKRNREKKNKSSAKISLIFNVLVFFLHFFQMLSSGCQLIDNKKWLERWHSTIVNAIPSLNDNNIIETKERKITQFIEVQTKFTIPICTRRFITRWNWPIQANTSKRPPQKSAHAINATIILMTSAFIYHFVRYLCVWASFK